MHHSDRGVQYLSIHYTERLAEAGIESSVGSVGDAYDNALAETIIGLYKTEVIHQLGPWRNGDHVEYEILRCVDWFNNRRLLEPTCLSVDRSGTFHQPSLKSYTTRDTRLRSWWPDSRNKGSGKAGAVQGVKWAASINCWEGHVPQLALVISIPPTVLFSMHCILTRHGQTAGRCAPVSLPIQYLPSRHGNRLSPLTETIE